MVFIIKSSVWFLFFITIFVTTYSFIISHFCDHLILFQKVPGGALKPSPPGQRGTFVPCPLWLVILLKRKGIIYHYIIIYILYIHYGGMVEVGLSLSRNFPTGISRVVDPPTGMCPRGIIIMPSTNKH